MGYTAYRCRYSEQTAPSNRVQVGVAYRTRGRGGGAVAQCGRAYTARMQHSYIHIDASHRARCKVEQRPAARTSTHPASVHGHVHAYMYIYMRINSVYKRVCVLCLCYN